MEKEFRSITDITANPNTEEIWAQIKVSIPFQEKELPIKTNLKSLFVRIGGIAALLLMVAFAAYFLIIDQQGQEWTLVENTSGIDVLLVDLPDDTKVWLNTKSKIEYLSDFDGPVRKVKLVGQAHFDVTKNPDKPFEVKTGPLTTKVLGTSFDIKAREGSHMISVALFEGKVGIQGKEADEYWTLNPEQVFYYSLNGTASLGRFNMSVRDIWRSQDWRFEEASVAEVLGIISPYFEGTKIHLNNKEFYQETISATFQKTDSIDLILELLCFSKGWTLEKQENAYAITE